jgi:di/tricarboxylate transporter
MTFEIFLVYTILGITLIVFALDIYPMEFVAFGVLATILALGPIVGVKPEEAIAGFSNPATITVMAMFIVSEGISRTGCVNRLAHWATKLAGSTELGQLTIVTLVISPFSAFINNTAAVAILMPMATMMAREYSRPPSKLLMPLSFFSQLAGVITLIGTSTNLLASALAEQEGYAPFGMFEFSAIGFLIFLTGNLYLLTIGRFLLPERRVEQTIAKNYRVQDYLTEVVIPKKSPLIGQNVAESSLRDMFDLQVLEILRQGKRLPRPIATQQFQADDIVLVKANKEQLLQHKGLKGLIISSEMELGEDALNNDQMGLLEVVLAPNSPLIGGTVESTDFRNRYKCTVIAMQKSGDLIWDGLERIRLDFGDTLLLRGTKFAIERAKREQSFIVTEEVTPMPFRPEKIPIALAIVAGVVGLATLGQSILVTSVVGATLMVVTGCLKVNELHESIRWDVILLLAGVLPLGLALERTGGAALLANVVAQTAQFVPPLVVLAIFYFASMLLTELISNNATVVVMVPVGVATAESLGLDARAFILAIMFAASTSFSTPVGYQTNTMVYGPGGYKFLDFTKVGLPLNLILAVVTPIYIYWLWGI